MDSRPRAFPVRPLVLVVEHREETRALYAIALMATGFEVVAAGDGSEAYGRASTMHPDVIVTELGVRPHDGWQLLADLKHDPRTRDIPVVIVTEDDPPALRERVKRACGAACLRRACLPHTLAFELRRILATITPQTHASSSR